MTANTPEKADAPIRLMIVDDSSPIRIILRRIFDRAEGIEVAMVAKNGKEAVEMLDPSHPDHSPVDVVTLDVEMPEMDGLTALPLMLKKQPNLGVIMVSTLTEKGSKAALKAISLGAASCIGKPSNNIAEITSLSEFGDELVQKAKQVYRMRRNTGATAFAGKRTEQAEPITLRDKPVQPVRAIAIASSTGGPEALNVFFTAFKGLKAQVPLFLTQHMPASFTRMLALQVASASGMECEEGQDGEVVKAGKIYLAPGDYHMQVKKQGADICIATNQDPPENFCRPAADPMLRSLAELYGSGVLLVVLTGMGADGLKGALAVTEKGGTVVAQDKATSVVWGMPGAVAKAGLCKGVYPLPEMGAKVKALIPGVFR